MAPNGFVKTKVNTVYVTESYGVFKRLIGNRGVDKSRVNAIIASIKKVGYVQSPIIVNEKYEVIDGQGRLEALKTLGLPVCFIVVEGIGKEECIAMNINQRNWSIVDFINSHAETGNDSYILLQQLLKEYGKTMSLPTIINAVKGIYSPNNETIKNGDFTCLLSEYDTARKILDYEMRFRDVFGKIGGRCEYYYMALAFCYNHQDIDPDRLFEKVCLKQAELIPVSKVDQALGVLESMYNYHSRKTDKVYLQNDYYRTLDDRYGWYSKKWGGK